MKAVGPIPRAIETLGQLCSAFQARRRALAARAGLTEQQWAVLEQVATEHFMPSLFAKQRDSSAAAVSKILRQLLDKGLVSVELKSTDGRQRAYALTAVGQERLRGIEQLRQRAVRSIWESLDPAALEGFVSFGSVLLEQLQHYDDTAIVLGDAPGRDRQSGP